MNELKKADEIVRALRDYASDCDGDETCFQCTFACVCDKFDNNAPKIIADLIDGLTAQLNEEISRRYQAECNYDHWKQQALESERREKAAVEDLKAILALACVAEVEGICNYCSDDGENCTGTTGLPGPQEAEKGEAK